MVNPQWLELPMSRTNFHGPKDVRAIEVRLYSNGFTNMPDERAEYFIVVLESDLIKAFSSVESPFSFAVELLNYDLIILRELHRN